MRLTAGAAALSMVPEAIRNAMAIAANNRTGTIQDVEHIVIFMQENRAFDHYFGTMKGVRGFGDPFPIPVPDTNALTGKTVWYQRNDVATGAEPKIQAPQHNDTTIDFGLLRTSGTPHLYPDAQDAWQDGRMNVWPRYKTAASMAYFKDSDIPFQFALANAFTIADANYCSFTGGTNPNRCFLYTGTNHGKDSGSNVYNGPAVDNSYNQLTNGANPGYTWMTYAERLEDAGVSWQVYQNNEKEFYALNSLMGFRTFRDAARVHTGVGQPSPTARQRALYEKGIKTRDLDLLKADVMADRLPRVSWICATSSGSEHPSSSSPAQGAAYTAQVLDALTSNPDVWSKTVLILNFDENDGLFDHMPPPAPPSLISWNADPALIELAGASTVDASDEYLGEDIGGINSVAAYKHRPYGLGPRVPMYVISPWSRGGWVNSQVFDQTSTIHFMEARFGVKEPNISPWRRAVVGDLTSCFNFKTPNDDNALRSLPDTDARNAASRTLGTTKRPTTAPLPVLPIQETGTRPSRALPYELHVSAVVQQGASRAKLIFANSGGVAAVFHVYNRRDLNAVPRRYTVEADKQLDGTWDLSMDGGAYDLWVLGPNGFHRHFSGKVTATGANPEVKVCYDIANASVHLKMYNTGTAPCAVTVRANAYFREGPWSASVAPGAETVLSWPLASSGQWYDFTLTVDNMQGYSRRFAGRLETGKDTVSDPAMGGMAVGTQVQVG